MENSRKFWYELCLEGKKNQATLAGIHSEHHEEDRAYREDSKLLPLPVWQDAVKAGIVSDREGYISLLKEISISLAISDLEKRSNKDEMTLIHLVRILDETDNSISRLSEKVEDYYIAQHLTELPGGERNIRSLIDAIARDRDHPLTILQKTSTGSMIPGPVSLQMCVNMPAKSCQTCLHSVAPW